MTVSLVERGVSQQPEVTTLDNLSRQDITRIAQISGGRILDNQGRVLGIGYQGGDIFLSLDEQFGICREARLGTRSRYFRMPTPAVLFRNSSVVFVSPQDFYDDGSIVTRTVTLSEDNAVVRDISADENLLDSDIATAMQTAEDYRVSVHERAVRNYREKHTRRRRW